MVATVKKLYVTNIMFNDIYILIGFGVLLLLYIVYSYNKNKSVDNDSDIDDEPSEHFTDDYDEEYVDYNIFPNEKLDVFPTGKSFLINPKTGLNKYGCNCICHNGTYVAHLAPCCGIKEVCGCACHLGIDIDHNTKCCDSAIIN